MTAKPSTIEHLRIATPCLISWEQMAGDNRVRFCGHCHLNVYNIAELTRIEAEALISATEGRLCARLFRRADGTVLTKDCPVGLQALRRRVAKRTAAIFAAIVSLSGAAFGQQSSALDKPSERLHTKITRKHIQDLQGTSLAITVTDVMGAVIADANRSITNLDTKETTNAATDNEGRFEVTSLAEGNYSFKIESPGFVACTNSSVFLNNGTAVTFNIVLEVGTVGELVLVDPPAASKN